MRRGVAAIALVAAAGACGKGSRVRPARDAAPVVMVDPGANRAAVEEKEPNGSRAEATPIKLGGAARGTLDGTDDVDVYKVPITAPGALKVAVSGVDGVDLVVEVADAGGAVVARSDRGPAPLGEGVPNLGVVRGDYFISVKELVKPAKPGKPRRGQPDAAPPVTRTGPSPAYELTAEVVTPAPDAEKEPDDDAGAANDLFPGDTVTGFIGWTGDVDVWKLSLETLTTNNAIDLELAALDGVTLTLEVSDAAGKPVQSRKGGKSAGVVLRSLAPRQPEGSPPFHYVRIKADRSNPDAPYTLSVRGRLLGLDEETEPNDKPEIALPLAGERGTLKATYAAGDVDCFAIAPQPEPQTVAITVQSPDGIDAAVRLEGPTGVLAKADAGKAGAAEKIETTLPAGARGVVIVTFKPPKADPGTSRDYEVEYSVTKVTDALPPEEKSPP